MTASPMLDLQNLTLNLDEIAAIFRRERTTMERTVKRWMRDKNFPKPLPDQKPRLWSRAAVEAWIEDPAGYRHIARFGGERRPGETAAELVEAVRAALERKYGEAA